MIGYVYKSEIANKVYVGKTISKIESRIKTHINHAFEQQAQTPICKALRTLDKESAYNSFSILETIEEENYEKLEEHLCNRENYWMDRLNSKYPNGYNVNKSSPSKRRVVKHQPPREKVMREVICRDTGERFKSMTDAAKSVGVDISAVYHCLKGVNNTAGGKHWLYADGEYHKCTRPEGYKNKVSQSKPVICKETGISYPSAGEASRQTGIISSNILKCAHGKVLSAGGYKWGFIINGEPVYKERYDKNKQRIMCLETGEIFDSISDCARSIGDKNAGTLQSTIKYGCRHKGKTYVKIDFNGNPVPSSWKHEKV